MTISPEYAAELGRQIDELEAENERLRSLIPSLIPAELQGVSQSSASSGGEWHIQQSVPSDGFECYYLLRNDVVVAEICGPQKEQRTRHLNALVIAANSSAEPQESPVSEFERDGIARCLFNKAMSGLAQWDEMTEPNKEDWRLLADDWILETTRRIEMSKGFRASPLTREASSPHPSQQGNCK